MELGDKIKNFKYDDILISHIFLVSIFIFFTFFKLQNALTAGFMFDEPETLFNARQIYTDKLPSVDYFEHHPIISYILLAPLSDVSIWKGQRILMAILSILGAVIIYLFLSNIFDKKISILCSISFLVSPLLNRMSIMIIPDSFMVFFFIAGLYFYGKILKDPKNSNLKYDFFLLGLFWSLSILSKIGSIIPITIFTLFLIYKNWNKKNYWRWKFAGYIIPLVVIFVTYRFNFIYFYSMIEGILSNVYVKQYYSQPFYDRISILVNQIFSMHIYLWIAGIIGFIYLLKLFREYQDKKWKEFQWKERLKDEKLIVILSSSISFFLLIYYNLKITVAGWPQYYLMNETLLCIMLAGFYLLIQKWHIPILLILLILFFGLIQPLTMSTYPYQINNHKEEQLLVEWLYDKNNINRDKYVFENWIYFNYLANLESDYKIPVFSDTAFYYLTLVNNSFLDHLSLRKNVYQNPEYDTVIFHGPMFDDLFFWIDMQFDKEGWHIAKRYNITMVDYKNQTLFWYPKFKLKTFDFQIDIWKRTSSSDTLEKIHIQKDTENNEEYIYRLMSEDRDSIILDDLETWDNQYFNRK